MRISSIEAIPVAYPELTTAMPSGTCASFGCRPMTDRSAGARPLLSGRKRRAPPAQSWTAWRRCLIGQDPVHSDTCGER